MGLAAVCGPQICVVVIGCLDNLDETCSMEVKADFDGQIRRQTPGVCERFASRA
jgi:hypothetical protein